MFLATIFILLIILGIGLPLTLLICPKANPATVFGVSFPLGLGVFTLIMFITNILGLRFSLLNESVILVLISLPLVLTQWIQIKKFYVNFILAFKKMKLTLIEKVSLGVLLFLIVTSFINTFYWPVHIWDSVVLYDFRGHVFALTGLMTPAFINNYYYSYPLLTSLAHTIIYLAGGKYPQFLYSLFYLSLGCGFYGLLREFVSRKISFIFTLVLLVAQPLFYHSLLSLTNLPFAVYLFFGSIFVFLWDRKKDTGHLILSAILVGLSTWTRSVEPFWLAIFLVVCLVSIYRKKIWNIIIYSLFLFPIREIWKIFQSHLASTQVLTAGQSDNYAKLILALFNISGWIKIFGFLYNSVIIPWGAIFPAFVLVVLLVLVIKKQRAYFLIFFITLVLLAVLVAGTFVFSVYVDNWFAIGNATERLSMLFYPFFVYCVALVMQEAVKIKK